MFGGKTDWIYLEGKASTVKPRHRKDWLGFKFVCLKHKRVVSKMGKYDYTNKVSVNLTMFMSKQQQRQAAKLHFDQKCFTAKLRNPLWRNSRRSSCLIISAICIINTLLLHLPTILYQRLQMPGDLDASFTGFEGEKNNVGIYFCLVYSHPK